MKREQYFFKGALVIFFALMLSGCNLPELSATSQPSPEVPTLAPSETPAVFFDPVNARDAVLTYIQEHHPENAPASDLLWIEEDITPKDQVGSSELLYSSGDWVMTVGFPIVAPELLVYQILVSNTTSGFQWEGEVDAAGQVIEHPLGGAGLSVVGWLGYVVSNPEGAQFDDYIVILPEGVGEFGIEGADETTASKIVDLRDKEEPGKYANFWGTLTCDVIDYNGCQLLVTHVRSGIELGQPEPITGWEGKIYSLEPGMQFDDYFVLAGDYPVQFGIASYIAENGLPVYAEELVGLRDTGELVRVSGQLLCGVPDVNGCQIQVGALKVNGTDVDPYQGWLTYTNDVYGYQFRHPANAIITEGGVDGFPTEELPEGMSADQYLEKLQEQYSNKLCVSVRYSFGYINISPPANKSFRYAICGRTGVGVGEMEDKSEQVYIAGQLASADGFEFIGGGETLPEHNETLVILLADGTRIEYGALPAEEATYEEYLLQAKPILLQILSTYEILN